MHWLVKLLIGFAAVLAMGWAWHGPAGRGEAFAASLDVAARAAVAPEGLPGIQVHMARDPIRRIAIMSGTTDPIQREGLGSGNGLADDVRAVPGIGGVHWTDEPGGPGGLPMLVETWLLLAIAYLLGFGLGALFVTRRRRDSFLD